MLSGWCHNGTGQLGWWWQWCILETTWQRHGLAEHCCLLWCPLCISDSHISFPTLAHRLTVAKAWVIESMFTSVIWMDSGSEIASEAMVVGSAIVGRQAFWATQDNNTLGWAWLSPGPWSSQAECGVWTSMAMILSSLQWSCSHHLYWLSQSCWICHLWIHVRVAFVGILLCSRGALTFDFPMAGSATWSTCWILGSAGDSARYTGLCTLAICMLWLGSAWVVYVSAAGEGVGVNSIFQQHWQTLIQGP